MAVIWGGQHSAHLNPVEVNEALQHVDESTLERYLKTPPPGIMPYQVASEVKRRVASWERDAALRAKMNQRAGTVVQDALYALNPGSFNPVPANPSQLAALRTPSDITGPNAPTSPPLSSPPINTGIASGMQQQPALSPPPMSAAQQPMQAAGGTMGRTVYAKHGGVPSGSVYNRGSDALEKAREMARKEGRLYSKERSRPFEGDLKNPYPEQELKRRAMLALLTSPAVAEKNRAYGGMGASAFASNGTQGRTVYAQSGYPPKKVSEAPPGVVSLTRVQLEEARNMGVGSVEQYNAEIARRQQAEGPSGLSEDAELEMPLLVSEKLIGEDEIADVPNSVFSPPDEEVGIIPPEQIRKEDVLERGIYYDEEGIAVFPQNPDQVPDNIIYDYSVENFVGVPLTTAQSKDDPELDEFSPGPDAAGREVKTLDEFSPSPDAAKREVKDGDKGILTTTTVNDQRPSQEERNKRAKQLNEQRQFNNYTSGLADPRRGGVSQEQLGKGFEPLEEVDIDGMRKDLTGKLTEESNEHFQELRDQIDKLKEYDPRADIKDVQQRRMDRIKQIKFDTNTQRLLAASAAFLGAPTFYEGFQKTMEELGALGKEEQKQVLALQNKIDDADLAARVAYANYQVKMTDTENAFLAARRADAKGNRKLAEEHIQTAIASRAAANDLKAAAAKNANARLALWIQQESVHHVKPTEAQTAMRELIDNVFVNGTEAERQKFGFTPNATSPDQLDLTIAGPQIGAHLKNVMPPSSSGLGAANFAMSVGRAQTDALEDIRTAWTKNQENLTTRKNTYPLREIEAFTGVSFPLADDGKGGRLNRLKSVRGDETAIAQQNRATLLWEAYQRYLNAGTDVERQAIFARYRELPSLIAAHEDRIKAIVEKQEGGEGDNETSVDPSQFLDKP